MNDDEGETPNSLMIKIMEHRSKSMMKRVNFS